MTYAAPGAAPTVAPYTPPSSDSNNSERKKISKDEDESVSAASPGSILVRLPADARLYINDRPSTLDSSVRRLVSPALPYGRTYPYTLRAEVTRDGKTVSETKRVLVRAGKEAAVDFRNLEATASARR